jgi:biotin transport system substrate-specific component
MEFIYRYAREAIFPVKLLIALFGAILLVFSGEIRISLPFTPVPVTAQTFALFLLAISLGFKTGILSFLFYFSLIVTFWGFRTFFSPTAGYLIGFFIAGILVSYLFDRFKWARKPLNLLIILTVANFLIIHGLGVLWLSFYFKTYNFYTLFLIGSAPFIIGDMLKIFVLGLIVKKYHSALKIND